MTGYSILPISKLDAFKLFLNKEGIPHRKKTPSIFVIQVFVEGKWHHIFERIYTPGYYAVQDQLVPIVQEFLKNSKSKAA